MSQPVFTDPRSIVDFEAERVADKPTVTPLPEAERAELRRLVHVEEHASIAVSNLVDRLLNEPLPEGACGVMGLCEEPKGHAGSHFTSVERAARLNDPSEAAPVPPREHRRTDSLDRLLRIEAAALEVVAAYDERGVLGWHINRLRAALTTGTPGADR